jgi:hypothetical protein
MRDLAELFREQVAALPTKELDDRSGDLPDTKAVFSADNLPVPPARVSTPGLLIRRGTHTYPSWRVDELHLYAEPALYQALGLCILATLFMPQPQDVTVELTHPDTEVNRLVIRPSLTSIPGDLAQVGGWPMGYIARPYAFVYYPERLAYAPLSSSSTRCREPLPIVHLVGDTSNSDDRDERDTVVGFGTDEAAAYFAGLLLNVGQPWQPQKEYSLESVAGYGGVGSGSAELRLWVESEFQ